MRRARRYLIVTIPQIDGGVRRLYARTSADARAAREDICRDRALIEYCDPAEYVDVDSDGTRRRYVLDGAE